MLRSQLSSDKNKKDRIRQTKLRWWHKNKEKILAERRSLGWAGNGKTI